MEQLTYPCVMPDHSIRECTEDEMVYLRKKQLTPDQRIADLEARISTFEKRLVAVEFLLAL